MKRAYQILSLVSGFILCCAWNNLNCPAPRAPDNGLNFIFRNGEVIHFRCHPGYIMYGKSVAHCVNNQWTHSAPLCFPIKRSNSNNVPNIPGDRNQTGLFNWGGHEDGARRLPLINGIGVPNTPVMVKEEIDIAELRHKQLQELRRKQGRKKNLEKKKNLGKRKNIGKKERSGKKKKVISEFKRKPIEEVGFDASCVENAYGRLLPKIAPSIPHAFVYAYETKKNKNYPFNTYMEVKYRCLAGYRFARTQTLFCRNNSWIGQKPRCITS
ncbi:CUB and sushi domain-containing protein 3 [Parasteatoda tepidariorum]|nr:uncharacterized protein LOC107448389 [Parasteatoda tepidariorum]